MVLISSEAQFAVSGKRQPAELGGAEQKGRRGREEKQADRQKRVHLDRQGHGVT